MRALVAAATLAGLLAVAPRPAAAQTAPVPADIVDRYLTVQPSLGPVTVIDLAGEPGDRKLLAATLQGIVNRTQARIYLLGMRQRSEDQYWLDWYQGQGLITVATTVDLDTALATFAGEVAGYVVADDAEPWTINTATSAAGALGGVVVTPATVADAQAAGLGELEDHRGRWPDAATAYAASVAAYRSQLAYPGMALEQPTRNEPRDFFVQQGVLTAYTRPSQPDFDAVYDLVDTYPNDHPLYGYVSDTGDEEVTAVARLALAGRFLVATDTTDNLSFHIAVGGAQRAVVATPDTSGVAPCRADDVNVVLAVSDGDNQVVPETRFPGTDAWGSPRRGELPFGWGLSPATAVLLPAVWDHYVTTATPADEIVDIMGLGYTFPTVMPNRDAYLTDVERLRAALGPPVHWSLDALIRTPDAAGWAGWQAATRATGTHPAGFLLNYTNFGGPAWFHQPDGLGVLASQEAAYGATPTDLAAEIAALQAAPAADRPLVNFFSVTVWSAGYAGLVDTLEPLQAQGVRFLTPSEALACLPPPVDEPATTTTIPTGTGEAPPADAVAGTAHYTG